MCLCVFEKMEKYRHQEAGNISLGCCIEDLQCYADEFAFCRVCRKTSKSLRRHQVCILERPGNIIENGLGRKGSRVKPTSSEAIVVTHTRNNEDLNCNYVLIGVTVDDLPKSPTLTSSSVMKFRLCLCTHFLVRHPQPQFGNKS